MSVEKLEAARKLVPPSNSRVRTLEALLGVKDISPRLPGLGGENKLFPEKPIVLVMPRLVVPRSTIALVEFVTARTTSIRGSKVTSLDTLSSRRKGSKEHSGRGRRRCHRCGEKHDFSGGQCSEGMARGLYPLINNPFKRPIRKAA